MRKKILLLIVIILILGVSGFIIWNNRTVVTIMMEINPSIEIRLNKNDKVVKVIPLNDDAKDIIPGKFYGKSLDSTMDMIIDNLISNNYVTDREVNIIMSITGVMDEDAIIVGIFDQFNEKNIHADIMVVDTVSAEDKKIASQYNISPVRAAYINMMLQENTNLDIVDLSNKPIRELRDIRNTGKYCDVGYSLEGDFCLKEKERINAPTGDVCPDEYYKYDGKCYRITPSIDGDEYACPDGYTLTEENECVGKEIHDAIPNFTCATGELMKRGNVRNQRYRDSGDWEEYVCENTADAKYPTERCYTSEHAIINGKCAMGPKPLLPTPTGCEGDDINYNGGCYDPTPDEPYICPDGFRYDTNDQPCPDTFTYTKASGNYTCPDGYILSGSKCTRDVVRSADFKKTCPDGYTIVDYDRCINKQDTAEFVKGYVCTEPDSRLVDDKCILYESVLAKFNIIE